MFSRYEILPLINQLPNVFTTIIVAQYHHKYYVELLQCNVFSNKKETREMFYKTTMRMYYVLWNVLCTLYYASVMHVINNPTNITNTIIL